MNYSFQKLLALIGIITLTPVIIIICLIIYIEDGNPVFFKQKRVGENNKIFTIYKFRTMLKNTPDIATHLIDSKLIKFTRIGPFLRKYSLDEIPQLFNIIKNEMVLIGPRPALYNQKDLIKKRIEKGIETLFPGITGWAQINGRDELEIDEKVEMDYYYLKNQSLSLDIRILFLTFIKAIKADGVYS